MNAKAEVLGEERKIKSYGLFGTMQFIEQTYSSELRKRISSKVPQETLDFIARGTKQLWAPPLYSCYVWEQMVAVASDEKEAFDKLVKCGLHMGEYATNTYLRLLLKVVNVRILAGKFPAIWRKDANFGDLSADATDAKQGRLQLRFDNLENYPYFGPICKGWFTFSWNAMGLKNVNLDLQDWSLSNPDPGKLTYQVSWTP
jgi:hypothetical protein